MSSPQQQQSQQSPSHAPVADLNILIEQVVDYLGDKSTPATTAESTLKQEDTTSADSPTQLTLPSQVVTIAGHELCFRLLQKDDYQKNYLQLLGQLTQISENQDLFQQQYDSLFKTALRHSYIIIVAENVETKQIVGTATLLLEHKFIRNFGTVGHIEDVVVDKSIRRCGVGLTLVQTLTAIGDKMNCYKTILDCSIDNEGFYVECGYVNKGVQMGKYF
jgi:glucosamine-phosphate N-acetyltransferase